MNGSDLYLLRRALWETPQVLGREVVPVVCHHFIIFCRELFVADSNYVMASRHVLEPVRVLDHSAMR